MTAAPPRVDDPLLSCLALMSKLIGRETHVNTLRAGFAVDEQGCIPEEAYPDVARQHGMQAQWARVGLEHIPAYALPTTARRSACKRPRSMLQRTQWGNHDCCTPPRG